MNVRFPKALAERPLGVLLAGLLALVLFVYLAIPASQAAPASLTASDPVTIAITGTGFEPSGRIIAAGTEVIWENTTGGDVTLQIQLTLAPTFLPVMASDEEALAQASLAQTGANPANSQETPGLITTTLKPGATFRYLFQVVGNHTFFLEINPNIIGHILVVRGGEVHGFVSALIQREKGGDIRLPNISVYLRRQSTGQEGPRVRTDAHGWYRLPEHRAGTYDLCMEAPGFAPTCAPEPAVIDNETFHFTSDAHIPPDFGVLHGQVLLADGTPCYRESAPFGTFRTTEVDLFDLGGTLVAGPVTANSQGEYVLPHIPGPGGYRLHAKCDGIEAELGVNLTSAHLSGLNGIDLTLRNRPPVIGRMVAELGGTPVRSAPPGAILAVEVSATDPEGDPLHYRWTDGRAGFVSVDAATISWPLQTDPATNYLFVEVRDDKGGFAQRTLVMKTGPSDVLFSGKVSELPGAPPIANAEVSVNGVAVTSDANGVFQVEVPESERYVLNAGKPGYSFLSQVFHAGTTGLDLRLEQANMRVFSPTEDVRLFDERQRVFISIKANTLVDPSGALPAGNLTAGTYYYDPAAPNGIPGDYSATDLSGGDGTLDSFGAFGVDIRDAAGVAYNLAPGETAEFTALVSAAQLPNAPPTIPLLVYDPATGYWVEKGEAQLVAGRYEGKVSSFSQWNTDVILSGPVSCIRVEVDEDRTRYPFNLRVTVPTSTGTDRVKVFPVTEQINGIFRLPPNTNIALDILPASGPSVVLKSFSVNSGAGVVDGGGNPDPFPLFDYSACNGDVTLALDLPSHTASWLSRKGGLNVTPAQQEAEANEYYTTIGAIGNADPDDNKDTLDKWKSANGFPTSEVVAYYYNAADLGFGRQMHCRQNGTSVACYVTNFGQIGDDPDDAIDDTIDSNNPIATVAMEYNPSAAQPVTFYVFNNQVANSPLIPFAILDTEGQKAVPHICLICHGGNYNASTNVVTGAAFREFDVFSFAYAETGFTLSNQQEAFRRLNAMVYATNPNSANANDPIRDLINNAATGLYHGSVNIPGTVATDTYVPSGWSAATTGDPPAAAGNKSALYNTIVKPYCRACHIAQSSYIDWKTYNQFHGAGSIDNSVCNTRDMPHAEVPFKNFWFSTNPHAPAYLADAATGLGFATPCTP